MTPPTTKEHKTSTTQPTIDVLNELPSPKDFYETYVRPRRPVVMKSCLAQFAPKLATLTLEELKKMVDVKNNKKDDDDDDGSDDATAAADDDVIVEVNRTKTGTSFSPADSTVERMPLTKLLDIFLSDASLSSSEDCYSYYLTTQTLPLEESTDRPALYTHPITQLVDNQIMELRPKKQQPNLLGNLIPMTYNLWIGKTRTSSSSSTTQAPSSASSSGLHHDFHDNLYCLVSGQKTFRIAPPELVKTVKMSGTLHTLHDNGRIVYEEQLPKVIERNSFDDDDENADKTNNKTTTTTMIRPDGAFESVERIMELETAIEKINEEIEKTEDETKVSELESKLNAMEEELLDLETMGNEEEEEEEDESDENSSGSNDKEDEDDSPDENEEEFPNFANNDDATASQPPKAKKQKIETPAPTTNCGDDNTSSTTSTTRKKKSLPVNFCLEEPKKHNDIDDGETDTQFQTVTISAGDLFFLPAGWFHEVQSHGGLHMALNYWTHPIDIDGSFERPYNSKFWERDWESRGLD